MSRFGNEGAVAFCIYTTVQVVALGYFVDILDLTLFNMVRVESLKSLGVSGQRFGESRMTLLNLQMFGMLVGVLFGVSWRMFTDAWYLYFPSFFIPLPTSLTRLGAI